MSRKAATDQCTEARASGAELDNGDTKREKTTWRKFLQYPDAFNASGYCIRCLLSGTVLRITARSTLDSAQTSFKTHIWHSTTRHNVLEAYKTQLSKVSQTPIGVAVGHQESLQVDIYILWQEGW